MMSYDITNHMMSQILLDAQVFFIPQFVLVWPSVNLYKTLEREEILRNGKLHSSWY